jgi:hypothetical protein
VFYFIACCQLASSAVLLTYVVPAGDCLQHGWRVEGGAILFGQGAGAGAGGRAKDVPPMELINNTLVYAKELERIV